jgi:hypothetical protein
VKIVFTICSNNYLAQAKILGDSILEFNSDYKFIIALCDELSDQIDYSIFEKFEIIKVKDIGITQLDIFERYNIIELNTSVKPTYFKHLLGKYEDTNVILYLDPDIQVFNSFSQIEDYLKVNDVLLTPHILQPIEIDNLIPGENLFLNYGIYNLGFIAFSPKGIDVLKFLNWWENKTYTSGYINPAHGIFVDQLWINHAPIFFENVKILMEKGYNVAPWNYHERNITKKINKKYIMDDNSELIFVHFSNLNINKPNRLANYYNRFHNRELSKHLKQLYQEYFNSLYNNNYTNYRKILCAYTVSPKKKSILKSLIMEITPPFIINFLRIIKHTK